MDSSVELSIAADENAADEIVALLSTIGFQGFWDDNGIIRAYMDLASWNEATMASAREMLLAYAVQKGIPRPDLTIRIIAPRNWNAEWEASIQPVQVSPHVVIAPSWRSVKPTPGMLVLTIDPKMSFGTGHHETTRLILTLMEPRITAVSTMLDFGTGTGVLAIAAVKLGAQRAIGVDTDEWSYENAMENVVTNAVEQTVSIYRGDLRAAPQGPYDIVAANIQRSVIEPVLRDLATRLTPKGTLLVSGILCSEADALREAFHRSDLRIEEERVENEWIAFALRHA